MKHIGLFEGIGGFSLAARWMGWETIAWCEINKFCQRILKYHFPNAEGHSDITTTDFSIYRGKCGLLTGGFPCQPFSIAGEQRGEDDERYLFNEMLRAVREVQPAFVVAENVHAITSRKFEKTFNEICSSLETEGYEVQAVIIPASAVSAPHERYRVWIIAYSNSNADRYFGKQNRKKNGLQKISRATVYSGQPARAITGDYSNSDSTRLQGGEISRSITGSATESEQFTTGLLCPDWKEFPTQPPLCRRDDGISDRVDRIKALGNAIVPQVAYQIFKAIEQTQLNFKAS